VSNVVRLGLLVLILRSVALLADEDEEVVPEEEKMTFHAQAELGVRLLLSARQQADQFPSRANHSLS
jgi:hypothetical protein